MKKMNDLITMVLCVCMVITSMGISYAEGTELRTLENPVVKPFGEAENAQGILSSDPDVAYVKDGQIFIKKQGNTVVTVKGKYGLKRSFDVTTKVQRDGNVYYAVYDNIDDYLDYSRLIFLAYVRTEYYAGHNLKKYVVNKKYKNSVKFKSLNTKLFTV